MSYMSSTHVNIHAWPILFLAVFIVFGFVGNALVCMAIKLDARLQNVTNYYLFSLATVDLLVSVIVIPLAIVKSLLKEWILGNVLCTLWIFFDVLLCTTSIMLLCVIACERYVGINDPLKTRDRSKSRTRSIIFLVWTLSILLSCPILVLAYADSANIIREGNCAMHNSHFIIYGSIISFIFPLLIMIVVYCLTVRRLHTVVKNFKLKETGSSSASLSPQSPQPPTERPAATQSSTISSFNFKLLTRLNASLKCNGGDNIQCEKQGESSQEQQTQLQQKEEKKRSTPSTAAVEGLRRITIATNSNSSLYSGYRFNGRSPTAIFNMRSSGSKNVLSAESKSLLNHDEQQSNKQPRSMNDDETTKSAVIEATSAALAPSLGVGAMRFAELVNKRRLIGRAVNAFQTRRETSRVKNEQKAVKVLGVVLVVFVIAWVPFAIVNILLAVCDKFVVDVNDNNDGFYVPMCSIPSDVLTTLAWLGYISSSINPLIYNAINERFRYAFRMILTCRWQALNKRQLAAQTSNASKLAAAKMTAHDMNALNSFSNHRMSSFRGSNRLLFATVNANRPSTNN